MTIISNNQLLFVNLKMYRFCFSPCVAVCACVSGSCLQKQVNFHIISLHIIFTSQF